MKKGKKKRGIWQDFRPCDPAGKSAAIYVRISRDDAGAKDPREAKESARVQRTQCERYAQEHGWETKLYQDINLSGFDDNEGRPDLQRMLDDMGRGIIHSVIVLEPKRLARDGAIMTSLLFGHFYPNGVQLHGVMSPINIASNDGLFMIDIEMAVSRKAISEQRRKSMASIDSQLKEHTFVPRPCYGYRLDDKGRFHVVESERAVILEMYRMCIAGESMNSISEYFNRAGVPGKRGARWWTHRQIKIVLTNPAYAGKIRYRGVHETSLIPKIVTQEMQERAAEMLAARSHKRAPSKRHLLSGLVTCSYCAERSRKGERTYPAMVLNIQKQGPKGDKKKYAYFFCQSQNRGLFRCGSPRVPEAALDAIVEGAIVPYVLDRYSMQIGADAHQETLKKLEAARGRVRLIGERNREIEDSFASGEMGKPEYLRLRDINQAKLSEAREEISVWLRVAETDDPDRAGAAVDVLQRWRETPVEKRRDAIRAFIDSIEVSANWVTFHVRPIGGDRWSFNVRMETVRRYLEKPMGDLKRHTEWTLGQAGYANQEPCPNVG